MLDGKTVLCVEDDLPYAEALELLCEVYAPTATCLHAPTLAEGLAVLQSRHVDVIVLDLRLPDAKDLVALYAFLSACPDTPIAILSAYRHYRLDALSAGARVYLVKGDIDNDTLMQTLEELVTPPAT